MLTKKLVREGNCKVKTEAMIRVFSLVVRLCTLDYFCNVAVGFTLKSQRNLSHLEMLIQHS